MNASRFSAVAVAAAALLGSTSVAAQDQQTYQQSSFGAPQPGVDVPYRYQSPQQSQQLLNPQTAQPQMEGAQSGNPNGLDQGSLRELDGAEESDFMMNSVVGISTANGDASEIIIEGSEIYMGVTPDHRDTLPHIGPYQSAGAEASRANQLTWLGFQPLDDRTRVFVQTGRPAQYQVAESPDGMTVTLRLRDTRIGLSNFMRFVDASHFDRPVSMIRTARNSDGVTEVTIELARGAAYEVVPDGNYLYVDFSE